MKSDLEITPALNWLALFEETLGFYELYTI